MKAVVLEEKGRLSLRDFPIEETLGPRDVRVRIHTVGVCGSDVHYYQHGAIGPFVVREPMILGHEAAGTVEEIGREVTHLQRGDRVCLEPGIPDAHSRASRLGRYNLDPAVRFWATPPIHGCLRPSVVHPADYTFKLPANVSMAEGAMVEPLAVGVHAVNRAGVKPGDVAAVIGAGPIGMLTALAALAGGCSRVFVTDVQAEKLALAGRFPGIVPVNGAKENLTACVRRETGDWGAEQVFEASGHPAGVASAIDVAAPGGKVTFIGMPGQPVPLDIVAAQVKELSMETIFRYAHVFPRAVALLASGRIDVKPLVTEVYAFDDSIKAFDYACRPKPSSVKVQIVL